jgi:hypothetical protein
MTRRGIALVTAVGICVAMAALAGGRASAAQPAADLILYGGGSC